LIPINHYFIKTNLFKLLLLYNKELCFITLALLKGIIGIICSKTIGNLKFHHITPHKTSRLKKVLKKSKKYLRERKKRYYLCQAKKEHHLVRQKFYYKM